MSSASEEMDSRLGFRVPARVKKRIEEAAHLRGMSLSDFATETLLERADAVVAQERVLELSAEAHEQFLSAIDQPPPPTEALRKAAQRQRALGLGNGNTDG